MRAVRDRGLPLVIIGQPAVPGAEMVATDNRGGAVAAGRHLVELGHRRCGILAPPDNSTQLLSTSGLATRGGRLSATEAARSKFRDNRERLAGYLYSLAGAGVDPADVPFRGRLRRHARPGTR